MIRPGDYVKTRTRLPMGYGDLAKGTTGTVLSLDGDWVKVKLPKGGRFETHKSSLIRIDRAQDL